MKNKHIKELLPDYLDGLLSQNQKKIVETHLKECGQCTNEMLRLKELLHAFEVEEFAIPKSSITTKFFEHIEDEKKSISKVVPLDSKSNYKRSTHIPKLLKIAASIALLVGAFLAGKYQSSENTNRKIVLLTQEKLKIKQTAMLSLMENKSASKRIQGVNFIEEFDIPIEAIIKALVDRMLYDENTNVRMSAVDVLENFTDSETVKNAFINALKIEKDPGIQITVIETLERLLDKKAAAPLQELLHKEDTQSFVKEKIKSVLPKII